ncbi:glycosyltransferase family 4 protein [Candidatus Woesearchaeota archaeon]|nr:glycosyltransferase family 4 protein [Candidatus Woesearchaeota archaeon]
MKVLMFGWEFPPMSSGGLGTACHGLTKGLVNHDVEVTFVLPNANDCPGSHVKLVSAFGGKVKIKGINSPITPYMSSSEYDERMIRKGSKGNPGSIYGRNLFQEVYLYSQMAAEVAKEEEFDVIHAHDWMTYQAGIKTKKATKKPLVVHMHATEFDRTGGNPNQYVYDIERKGLHEADQIIAVSNFTKRKIIEHYGINPEKVTVVHNAVEFNTNHFCDAKISSDEKVVLFLGRITIQKGPDWFLYAAKRVLEKDPHVKFVIVGSGDMEPDIIEKAAELGISKNVLFSGFLKGKDVDRAYAMADLYVMPSISEPFGITPLEAMRNNTPVLISKQSGVSEVLSHALKVDFWDVDAMADKILAVLQYPILKEALQQNGSTEVTRFNWDIPASKCIEVYNKMIGGAS